jgi:hypothetical protein
LFRGEGESSRVGVVGSKISGWLRQAQCLAVILQDVWKGKLEGSQRAAADKQARPG